MSGRPPAEDIANSAGATDRTPVAAADVCVVGAGPAGALVADRLADAGHEVVVGSATVLTVVTDSDGRAAAGSEGGERGGGVAAGQFHGGVRQT